MVRCHALAAFALIAGPALAASPVPPQVYTYTTSPEYRTSIGFFASLNKDCTSAGPLQMQIVTPPANGTAALESAYGSPRYPAGSDYAACNTKQVQGMRLIYTSNPGFTGVDSFDVLIAFSSGVRQPLHYDITVK